MSGGRLRARTAGLLLAAAAVAMPDLRAAEPAGSAAAEAAERRQLLAERRRIEVSHGERERACADRFAVTACLDENRREQREALAAVEARLADLDDRQRARRAEARQRRIDAKVRAKAREERASEPLLVLPKIDRAR